MERVTHRLHIDIETFSSVDIKKAGLYRYVQAPDFQVLLQAYAFDDQPARLVDLTRGVSETAKANMLRYLTDPRTLKCAYNAAFEWYCLSHYFGQWLPLEQWRCTMAHGLYCGLPDGLAKVGAALGLGEDKKKMWQGGRLIQTFCVPQKPSKANGQRTRILPGQEPAKWELFGQYCMQDVEAEREVERRLAPWPMPEREQALWQLDVRMNTLGVQVDTGLVTGAIRLGAQVAGELEQEAIGISGMQNPKSVAQLKKWLEEEGQPVESLTKEAVSAVLETTSSGAVRRMLEIRQELSKTSVKKYEAMERALCGDGRVRGLLRYYGANRTGRWTGRIVQPQNLPRNYLKTLGHARELVAGQKLEALRLCYGNVPGTLSQLIRTAFIPAPGHSFVVADFSAIEARIIAWLAGERWRMDVFATHGKIYEASAEAMFGLPPRSVTKDSPMRQRGKVAELALGYGGSTGALIAMGALKNGLAEEELPDIVKRWRAASPAIVRLWKETEACALETVKSGRPTGCHGIGFGLQGAGEYLTVRLPSGRDLFYVAPQICVGKFGGDALCYMGVDQESRKWERTDTFGGKLTENIVQAIARDCLAETLLRLEARGMRTVFHVHDEVVLECPAGGEKQCLEAALDVMKAPMPWASGLRLKGEGFTCDYYRKE